MAKISLEDRLSAVNLPYFFIFLILEQYMRAFCPIGLLACI